MAKKRIILPDDSDSDSDELESANAATGALPDADTPTARPSRRTKDSAKKKWESLIPAQGRKKAKVNDRLLNEDGGNNPAPAPSSKPHKWKTNTEQPKATRNPLSNTHRAPRIDPNASSGDENEPQDGGSSKKSQSWKTRSEKQARHDGHNSPHHASIPPKFRKAQESKPASQDVDEGWSSDEDKQENVSPSDNDSDEAARTEDDDDGLEYLEKNPRALEKQFADEAACFIDDSGALSPARSRQSSGFPPASRSPSQSGQEDSTEALASHSQSRHPGSRISSSAKKRPLEEESDADAEADAPPPKKPLKKKVIDGSRRHTPSTDKSSHSPALSKGMKKSVSNTGMKDAPKRVSKHRESEIPKFREPVDSDADTPSNVRETAKSSHAPSKPSARKSARRAGSDEESPIEDASDTNSDADDSGIEIVPPQSGKLALGVQHRRVRRVLKRAIYTTHVDIATKNAFPDGPHKHGNTVHKALVNAATKFAYDDILRRLKKDEHYATQLCRIPSQRISTFRGLNKTVKANKVYSPPIFIEILRVAFFKRANSFGFSVSRFFESSLPDKPEEKEIPASMLALVATALYAAIDDCKNRLAQPRHFTANDYWNVYRDHIQELSNIRTKGPLQYHVLMHGFWRNLCAPAGTSGVTGAPRKSLLDIAGMAVE